MKIESGSTSRVSPTSKSPAASHVHEVVRCTCSSAGSPTIEKNAMAAATNETTTDSVEM